MSDKIKPLPPVKVKINFGNSFKLYLMIFVSIILWVLLFVTGINLLSHYIITIFREGFYHPETLKYSLVLIVGAYFFLILDKNKIYEALNIKRDLPFITIEQIKKK